MTGARLSICIATRNRGDLIGETLDSIISQVVGSIEIVILDGGSTDNTEDVVTARQRQWPALRYFKQPKNGGVDRDFDLAVQQATGEYCWLMSDDDILKPGAVAAVLEATGRGSSLIVLNAEVRDNDLSNLLQERRLGIPEDRYFSSEETDELFATAGAYLTFIGCVIIKRSLWNERDRETYYGTLFIHVGVIFQKALPEGALVLASPLISIRYGNAMWTPRGFEIWMRKWPDLVGSFVDLSDLAKAKACPQDSGVQFRRLIFFRAQGVYSLQEYASLIEPDPKWTGMRSVAKLVAITPGVLVNCAVFLYLHTLGRMLDPAWRVFLSDVVHSPFFIRHWVKGLIRR
jgi:abequosyltransferase